MSIDVNWGHHPTKFREIHDSFTGTPSKLWDDLSQPTEARTPELPAGIAIALGHTCRRNSGAEAW